jgi:hypothetical protein
MYLIVQFEGMGIEDQGASNHTGRFLNFHH